MVIEAKKDHLGADLEISEDGLEKEEGAEVHLLGGAIWWAWEVE